MNVYTGKCVRARASVWVWWYAHSSMNAIFRSFSLKMMQFMLFVVAVAAFFSFNLMMPLMFVIWVNYYWLQAISKLQNLCLAQARMKWITQQRSELRVFNINIFNTKQYCTISHRMMDGQVLATILYYTCTQILSVRDTYKWSILCADSALRKNHRFMKNEHPVNTVRTLLKIDIH